MASFKALCLAGAASLVATASGHAADLLPPPPPPPVYAPPAPVVLGGNWYLRGDVGVGIADLRTQPSTFQSEVVAPRYEQSSLDDAGFVDAGVGYRFNRFFRADVTGDYHAASQYSAIETYDAGIFKTPQTDQRNADAYRGNIRTVDALLNGYIDLGTWNCITPFVGGGVGFANINVGSIIDNGEGGGIGYSGGHNQTNFAFAAMAGLDFQVSRNLVFEIGYRYLNVGNAASGEIHCQNQSPCPNEVQHYKLAENDIRLGLRYILPDFAAVGPAPVLMTRY